MNPFPVKQAYALEPLKRTQRGRSYDLDYFLGGVTILRQ